MASAREPIELFDANVALAKPLAPPRGGWLDADRLIRCVGGLGIARFLTHSATAMDNDPNVGNAELLRHIENQPRCVPCWVALPHHSGEFPSPGELLDAMKEKDIRAIRLFPEAYGIEFTPLLFGDLIAELDVRRMPVFLELAVKPAPCFWDHLEQVCRTFENTPVILSGSRLGTHARQICAVFDRCPNVKIETAGYQVFRGIEFVCERYGAHRLVFRTRMPFLNPAPAITAIAYAEISDNDKRLVAGENLQSVLEGVVS